MRDFFAEEQPQQVYLAATKPDGMPRKLLDISLIRSLGWEARIALEDGLKDAYQWFTQHAL
ncbi:GDP-L-fucose synthetase [Thioalkalivibrio nitratireducens DSM 14787]|uniref:GDP-L-fucose synthetase n=1 Tax=Thioalkalivibrio nitratireducens (strain DSM 14787 / UNIQEM 213 / ALEN2) TaxID=1255043 RepID=L0DVG3_THIND|nr:GDP-L-fucose synthetase [Thioalkalivibrio nitratireducens]AGA32341.1 GDP-L-fucose synthetase [Thioalkalivibrio nitratireducens DSM 14787]